MKGEWKRKRGKKCREMGCKVEDVGWLLVFLRLRDFNSIIDSDDQSAIPRAYCSLCHFLSFAYYCILNDGSTSVKHMLIFFYSKSR